MPQTQTLQLIQQMKANLLGHEQGCTKLWLGHKYVPNMNMKEADLGPYKRRDITNHETGKGAKKTVLRLGATLPERQILEFTLMSHEYYVLLKSLTGCRIYY